MTAYLPVLLAAGVFLLPEICRAQEDAVSSIGVDDDCGDVSVVFRNGSDLTRQERISLMDKALMHSLSKYERCQLSASSSGGGGSAGGNGSSSGGSAGNGQQGASTASSEMSGTQTPAESTDSGNASAANSKADKETNPEASQTHAGSPSPRKHTRGSGQTPKDIPPVDNDSVLEEQIRQAAMNETDPVIKARLWNEYRKYKGLPVVTKPKR
ncbi:MAG: hypothetical protein Q9M30_02485 [Mariprofundaceae bacterium]|nr:hypothetical protein [Mariprofundaceae bacterium]